MIRELYKFRKGLNERIDEGILRWFSHTERMERDNIAKTSRVYVEECADSHSMGGPQKRWIDIVKEYLKKRELDTREARSMVQDKNEWRGFVKGNAWGVAQEMNP